MEVGEAHMEEKEEEEEEEERGLLAGGTEETARGPQSRPSLRQSYRGDALLAPDTYFMADDRSSPPGDLDVADRLTYLEQHMQMQEDEIQLLKMALADVLKRLSFSEEYQAADGRRAAGSGVKARPVSMGLPSRGPTVNFNTAPVKKSTTLPSTTPAGNCSPSPTPSKSVKDASCKTAKAGPSAANLTSKKAPDSSKANDPAVSLGTRRVTHCKVTMQIYLSPHAKRTGCSEAATLASAVEAHSSGPHGPATPRVTTGGARNKLPPPSFTLTLQETTSAPVSQSGPLDMSTYRSPVKSLSQYFQICY